ncbi:MAG: hypothetical protein JO267_02915 [Alphaproteobacteria bacterium]|nr:hypothetical protein [Alphaproteobacteria bacterium]
MHRNDRALTAAQRDRLVEIYDRLLELYVAREEAANEGDYLRVEDLQREIDTLLRTKSAIKNWAVLGSA